MKTKTLDELIAELRFLLQNLVLPASGINTAWIKRVNTAKQMEAKILELFGELGRERIRLLEKECLYDCSARAVWEIRSVIAFGFDWILELEESLRKFDSADPQSLRNMPTEHRLHVIH